MSSFGILIVTGASGAGKSTIVDELDARAIPGVRCFHFDSIGVPTPEAMERDYGSGEAWQASATVNWLGTLSRLPTTVHLAVLEGQTRPSVVLDAAASAAPRTLHVALVDCDAHVRSARLAGPRGQPELASPQMDCWAAYLRGQADALRLPVIDTTSLTTADATDRLEAVVRRLIGIEESPT